MGHATDDSEVLLTDFDTASSAIFASTWDDGRRQDRVGVEIEAFPVVVGDRLPIGRLPLWGFESGHGVVEGLAQKGGLIAPSWGQPPAFPTLHGGRVTFEPGGQVEYSTRVNSDMASLWAEVDELWDLLSRVYEEIGVRLAPLGLDPWHTTGEVPQQHRAGRYTAMARYFSSGWPDGAVMMRNTCSIQVNLESGTGRAREERWLAANLVSPILTAMFASSPDIGGTSSRRAAVWQRIDPTRTGFPHWRGVEDADPRADTEHRALSSNVMFSCRGNSVVDVPPGWPFSAWVEEGHPEFGPPSVSDLETHLSTLFPEVRPRGGTLELRGLDSLPRRWWPAPVTVWASLIYDDQARGQAIDMLSPAAASLRAIWRVASARGLADPELGRVAEKVAQLAVDAARRLDLVDGQSLRVTEEFLERFTMRGLSPADELRPLLGDPSASLAWALGDDRGVLR